MCIAAEQHQALNSIAICALFSVFFEKAFSTDVEPLSVDDPASTRRQNYGSYSRYYPYRIATGWLQWPIRRLWLRVWSRRRRYPWNRPDRRCRSYGVGPNLTMHQ